MTYLSNIPENSKNYGLNKLLVVRDLTIDWKHRDTELFIRSPKLLSSVTKHIKLEQLLFKRSHQLRYIHHISRKVLFNEKPQDIVDYPHLYTQINKIHNYSQVYIDFACIYLGGTEIYKQLDHANITVFCFHNEERAMIREITSKRLPLPKQFRKLTMEQITELSSDSIISLFIHKNNITLPKKKLLWALGYHIYQVENGMFKYVTFKTDLSLSK